MKILLAGNYHHFFYEEVCAREMERLGHEVIRFAYRDFYRGFWGKLEQHFIFPGPQTRRLNRHLIRVALEHRPDVVIVWRGTHILHSTLVMIKRYLHTCLVSYVNDDPFGPQYRSGNWHQRRLWHLFRKTIPVFDQNYVFRATNIQEYKAAGAQHADLFLPYYIPELFENIEKPALPEHDVVFIGHYEPHRLESIRYLLANGVQVKLYGTGWDAAALNLSRDAQPIAPIHGSGYYHALLNARIALGFLSKLNRDEYTRRSFEIPGCGALMLCERTEAMQALFEEGREAVYFSSKEELLEKTQMLLADEDLRQRIAAAGQTRCQKSGYDVRSRVKDWMTRIEAAKVP